ncbi:uncharacterized protein PADG_06812 [Paracoccidioides brasiliensis Pb18]|uniref:Uncharacterized protein n=1 Tax=Paracoccidioides brasiliensis (strain Pb18) TaxID=502780 RepID=C1GHS6_PARBD|nr:uncharacterized protein PADG_06812 [Paracoccidioides brasiliensis Pb18]EEH50733.2 hypothetical protein PADG_06812 [Paracoccidioides brasiliensis Pb18]ODH47627.1 hypothetical protein GX48_06244 [Paracoccidioides brasiliensis]
MALNAFLGYVCPAKRHAVSNLRDYSKRMDMVPQWIAFLSGQNCDESFRPGTWAHELLQMSVKSLQKIADKNNLPKEAISILLISNKSFRKLETKYADYC